MLAECKDDNVKDPMQCFYKTLSTEDVVVYGEVPGLVSYLLKTFASGSFSNVFPYEPYIDNDMVKSNLIDGEIRKPLLIGNNRSESNIFLALLQRKYNFSNKLVYKLFLKDMFRSLDQTELLKMYPYESDNPLKGVQNLINDYAFKCASQTFIETNTFADTYLYKFDFESGFNRWQNGDTCDAPEVCHAADIPYTFDQFYYSDDMPISTVTANEKEFSAVMISRWSEFDKTLTLNGFAPYSSDIENIIEINNNAPYFFEQSGTFSADHHCEFWREYYKVQENP